MPTPRETILAALHARLSALPATALRGDVLPERVAAGERVAERVADAVIERLRVKLRDCARERERE